MRYLSATTRFVAPARTMYVLSVARSICNGRASCFSNTIQSRLFFGFMFCFLLLCCQWIANSADTLHEHVSCSRVARYLYSNYPCRHSAGVGRGFSRVCLCVCVSVCLSALKQENGLSYQHQTWYTYTLQQSLGMHWPRGQKVRSQGHMVTKTVAGVGLHVDTTAYVF